MKEQTFALIDSMSFEDKIAVLQYLSSSIAYDQLGKRVVSDLLDTSRVYEINTPFHFEGASAVLKKLARERKGNAV